MSNQIVRRTFLKYCVLMTGSVVSGTYLLSSASYAAQSGKPLRILVVYFSMPETDNPHNMSREEENSTVVINGKVLDQDARPAIQGKIESPEAYDTIFIGYPNWWGDMPMILYTFLEQYDFSGKTIIPFCTHGGSGFSRTIRTMQDKQPGATVIRNGYSLSRSRMERAPSGVAEWLKEIGLKK